MADFSRLNKYRQELTKAKEKRTEMDARIRELERRCKEEEAVAIRDIVRDAGLSPEGLESLVHKNAGEKLAAINAEADKESEDSDYDEENE